MLGALDLSRAPCDRSAFSSLTGGNLLTSQIHTLIHTHTHAHTHMRAHRLQSRQINLRDRSEDAASHREGQTHRGVGEGEGPAAGGMKSHHINIHEPSHLSERDSSVSLAVEPEGEGRGEKEGRKGGDTGRQDG